MNLKNLYHDPQTTNQIKTLRRARAIEMKAHTDAMKAITNKYESTEMLLTTLRAQELAIGNSVNQGRYTDDQMRQLEGVLLVNRKKATSVMNKLLKNTIDIL